VVNMPPFLIRWPAAPKVVAAMGLIPASQGDDVLPNVGARLSRPASGRSRCWGAGCRPFRLTAARAGECGL